jgi:hypothetical protein
MKEITHDEVLKWTLNPTQFMVGNFIKDEVSGELMVVSELKRDEVVAVLVDRSKYPLSKGWSMAPVPLTEEWVIKFGLEKIEHSNYNEWGDESFFIIDERGAGKWHHYSSPGTFYFQWVHQLQNLYFALTGTELTLKAGS